MSYALVYVGTGEVIQTYLGDKTPSVVVWPNGDASHCPIPGDERAGARFVAVVYGPDSPGEFYQRTATIPQLNGTILNMVYTWVAVDLATVQGVLKERVDILAEVERGKYVTSGSGQALTYLGKLLEAKAFLANQVYNAEAYPLLTASMTGTTTIAQTAQMIVDAAARSAVVTARIEWQRLQAKRDIAAASDVDSAVAIISGITWL